MIVDEWKDRTLDDAVEQVPLQEKPKAADSKRREDERLDEAAEESFPASDPVSVKITKI